MHQIDFIVILVYLVIVMAIGWRFRLKEASQEGYFLASRAMGWFPIGLSVMVTTFSAINYLALPNEVFGYGLYVIAALPVFFLAAWPVTKIWMPFFHRLELTSVYEYLELRFDRRVRSLASAIFILWRLFWMATALYASGKIMAGFVKVPVPLIILTGGITATVYTFAGGMRAVMWTDVLQFFILFGGIVLGVYFAIGNDGIGDLIEIAYQGGRLKPFLPFDPNYLSFDPRIRMTLWSGLIGVFVAFLSRYGADQVVMQRYFTARSLKMAQRGLWFNAIVSVFALSMLAFLGLAVYVFAVKNGAIDPDQSSQLSAVQLKGLAMKQTAAIIKSFPAGVSGLVVAGLLAATMSSIDSGVNACSAAYITDFHRPKSTESSIQQDRRLSLIIGVLSTLVALLLIPLVGKTNSLFMVVNKLINGLGSPLLALFVLGMFTRRANGPGMFWGGLVGVILSMAISLFVKPLALQYYAALNLLVTVIPCLVFSWLAAIAGHKPETDIDKYLVYNRGS